MRSLVAVVLFLVAACGDDGVHHQPDAPPAPDAPDIDAAMSGAVTLTVAANGTGVEGVKVYFQHADSSLKEMKLTDVSGVATAIMEPGGFVTAVDPFPTPTLGGTSFYDLRTFAGVKPGDQLKLSTGRGPLVSVTFTLALPLDVNASQYQIYTSCGFAGSLTNPGGSGAVPMGPVTLSGCGATADMVIETVDINGAPLGAFYHPAVAISEGASVVLTDSYTPVPDFVVSYSNVAADFTYLDFINALATANGQLIDTFRRVELAAGAGTATFKLPAVTGGLSVHESHLRSSGGEHFILDWGPAGATQTVDLANLPLPAYQDFPTLDVATHAMNWTAGASATQPDFVIMSFGIARTVPTSQIVDWQIVAPYTGTTLALPVLPSGIDQANPIATDTSNLYEIITAKVPGGYDAVRGNIFATNGPTDLIAGATGRIVHEQLPFGAFARPAPSAQHRRPAFAVFPR
jgi:hypothetical protein